MTTRLTAFLTVWFLLFIVAAPVFAEGEQSVTVTEEETPAVTYHYIIDDDGIISDENKANIESAAAALYQRCGVDAFCYLIEKELEKPGSIANKIYKKRADTDAAVVLLYEGNTVHIYSYGRARELLTDDECSDIMHNANAQETYTRAFLNYIDGVSDVLMKKGTLPIPSERLLPRFVDYAGLVSGDDASALLETLNTISEAHQMDVVVVTQYSLGGKTPMEYADDFYDYNGYGFGENRDGILLLLGMEDRDWRITTTGKGITVFTDAGQEYMSDRFVSYLSDGDYYGGFNRFAELCDEFMTHYEETDKAYDTGDLPKEPFGWFMAILGCGVGGLLVGLITVTVMKSDLKSVRPQAAAGAYTKPGSLKISLKNDVYLYNTVSRTAKPQDTDSGSHSSGGGSSSHSSSSGSSHGGSGGHF
ncbi:MAG: TPM domain-containing protein [Clostridia bacterium]|nr:TPM domain-containing protein [Clostridia bacterium]